MFKNIKKEINSLLKGFNKLDNSAQLGLFFVVVMIIYFLFFKNHSLGFSFLNHLKVNEGFTGDGQNITFYKMTNCKYCAEFQPKWDKFVSENPEAKVRIVMADDADKKELEGNHIQGYPTILLTDSNNLKIKEIPRDKFDEKDGVKNLVSN
jgi:hypothetical protein